MYHGGDMNFLLETVACAVLTCQQARRPRKGEFGMIADQQRLFRRRAFCELARDHRSRLGAQGVGKVLRLFDENEIIPRSSVDAGHATHFYSAVAVKASVQRTGELGK